MKILQWFVFLSVFVIIFGCSSDSGPDAISARKTPAGGVVTTCTLCHNGALDPMTTNGSGTAGKHTVHFGTRGIACERCHNNYMTQPTHMNGVMDTGNPAVNMVSFDIIGPAGSWVGDTAPQTGSCASVACHNSDTLDWYGVAGWTTPATCTDCHASAYSPALDPAVTNGSGTAGKHITHVSVRDIQCGKCHLNYTATVTHMNGQLDTGIYTVNLVNFNLAVPGGSWTGDTGPQTGSCSSVSCHDATLAWYGTAGWTLPANCSVCHTGALDPATTNGAGTAGKHVEHVSVRTIACDKCHHDYTDANTHINGQFDTPYPAVNMVIFNLATPGGSWINDTGVQTGQCTSVDCHGISTLDWYGLGGWTFPACSICHTGALDPVFTNSSGVWGKHAKHVNITGIACDKCHLNYLSNTSHMNGQLDTADPAVLSVYFDATNPGGVWSGDTGVQTGSCTTLNCHKPDTLQWYGTAGWTTPANCSLCHSSITGTRRQVMGSMGDFGNHTSIKYHHVSGGSDPTPVQCKVCHDMITHMAGTVRVKNPDTGASIAYNPVLPSTIETFCLNCHDVNGAGGNLSPFADGRTLGTAPFSASTSIKTNWNKSYGHKQKGLTCIGNGSLNTGCHGNGHGTRYVSLLVKNLQIPQPNRYRETDFSICLDCHQSYANVTKEVIFGVMTSGPRYDRGYGPTQDPVIRPGRTRYPPYDLPGGIQTIFRDRNASPPTKPPYEDPILFSSYTNLHWYHITSQTWRFRGIAPNTGISCTACHSVHGTNTQWGMVYDSLQYNHYTVGTDQYGMMSVNVATLNQYPTYCALNCHNFFGPQPTHNWFEPPNE